MRTRPSPLPPPILMLLLALGAYLLARATPAWHWANPAPIALGIVLAFAGLACNVAPKFAFRRARTTVNPLRPQAASQLVTDGLYRITRNPMYVGHALMLSGWAVGLDHPLALFAPVVYVAWIDGWQIPPEEAALAARFPEAFADYTRRVRRWL